MRTRAIVLLLLSLVNSQAEVAVFPRGVASPAERVAYVTTTPDGIMALDLVKGRELWRAASSDIPVGLYQGQLVTIAQDVARPGWILTTRHRGPSLRPTKAFAVRLPAAYGDIAPSFVATQHGDTVRISWTHAPVRITGNPRQSPVGQASAPVEQGAINVDLETGEVSHDHVLPTTSTVPTLQYRRAGEWIAQPWRVGDKVVRLTGARKDGRTSVLLTTGTGTTHLTTRLDTLGAPQAYVSLDGRYVALVDSGEARAATVYSALSGKRLGGIPGLTSADALTIIEPTAYWLLSAASGNLVEDTLHASRIGGEREAWHISLGRRPASPRPVR